MIFKKDEIIFLLGAGASVEAGIPASRDMIGELEQLLESDDDWCAYKQLYYFVKSAIIFADGIKGRFDGANFNIERLVNTLDELRKSDEHPLFPFIGSWTPKLPEVSGKDFSRISEFRKKIVDQLSRHWVRPEYEDKADYYSGLYRFQKDYEYPLRVFTLNYDLCVEKTCQESGVERGFSGRSWDWRVFDNEDQSEKKIFLYKLHGSIDWDRDDSGILKYKEGNIEQDKLEIIFGTTYKLQYIDPFLFFAYEFRKRTLTDARLIICVGYGFADEHINGIIGQALKNGSNRRLLIIAPEEEDAIKKQVQDAVDSVSDAQITAWKMGASEFFTDHLTIDQISSVFPEEAAPFEELGVVGS